MGRRSGQSLVNHGLCGFSLHREFLKNLTQELAATVTSSLALVVPSNLRWYVTLDLRKRQQLRVRFNLTCQRFDLPVTDLAWSARIARRLAGALDKEHSTEALASRKTAAYISPSV
jgi:hypothetical protein